MAASSVTRNPMLSSCRNLLKFKHNITLKLCYNYSTLVKKADIDPEIDRSLSNEIFKHRKHPGIRKIPVIELPKEFQKTATYLLKDIDSIQLKNNSIKFCHFLRHRVPAWTKEEIDEKSKEVETKLKEKYGDINLKDLNYEEKAKAEQSRKSKIREKLNQLVYHWKPVEYTAYKGYLYLYGRACANYAATFKVFDELLKSDPTFNPKTVFDFGSGIGTTIWAAKEKWGKNIKEFFCVDTSEDMNSLAMLLLKGKDNKEENLKGFFFRQFLPASNVLKYDLVVCSYALLEMATIEERIQVVENLWAKTQDILVIVDKGTQAGFQVVLEARDFILQSSQNNHEENVHVVAPCPHEKLCPKFIRKSKYPCGFAVKYQPFSLEEKQSPIATEVYSYVVLRKEKRTNDKPWPRIIAEVLNRPKHCICRLCCNDGSLHEIILSKGKSNPNLYKCARKSYWGDLLPIDIHLQEVEEIKNSEKLDPVFTDSDKIKEN